MFFLVLVKDDEFDIASFRHLIFACVSIDLFLIVIAIHAACSADFKPRRHGKSKEDSDYEPLPNSPTVSHPIKGMGEEEKEK